MASTASTGTSSQFALPAFDVLKSRFESDGFLHLQGVVERASLQRLASALVEQLEADRRSGRLFSGGGNVSGHLNCFPGEGSRFVYQELEQAGIFDLAARLSGKALRAPNIGCNMNLPGSSPQNEHVDGYAATKFIIVNVAVVDTDLANGAMEVFPTSHAKQLKLWQIMLSRQGRRVCMKQGDVVVRSSMLWHRGMPNKTATPRPMLAFTWEDGGSDLPDPYQINDGRITFLPNRFRTDWKGRMMERAFVAAPRLGRAYKAALSIFETPRA